jgi:hypothetical protein
LGAGGFAVTYVVYDLRLHCEQVLKVLIATLPKAIELFEQEAQVLASLNHRGVPRVEPDSYFRVLVGNPLRRSLPCLVMEKINGQTLEDVLEQHPQGCPEAWVVDWFQQAIDILQVLHQRQIIHRDLKPANLMLRQGSGQLVLIDFGGAKQMRPLLPAQSSSTRLVSPGYSPPEQASGGSIQPASDFYALGRTLIHLLTGRYPAELENPMTGELKWRNHAQVTPPLADLLDELVQSDVHQRPATAAAVQARLLPIALFVRRRSGQQQTAQTVQRGIKEAQQAITRITGALWRMMIRVLKALVDTVWSMLLGALGAGLGTIAGFGIAYHTALGTRLAARLSQELALLLPFQPRIGADFLLFALAGLGTAWGLTIAGGFGQRRRFWIASMMGILGYLFGWVGLQLAQPDGAAVALAVFAAIAPALLTVGLGLPSFALTHALVASVGLAPFVALLTLLNVWFTGDLWQLATSAAPVADGLTFLACLCFFTLLGAGLGCCLGISYYLFVPLLRLMGW